MWRSILLVVAVVSIASGPSLAEPVSFTRQVAPILVRNCETCHGAREPKGEYRISTFQQLLQSGESQSAPVVAGKPAESYLFTLITAGDDSRMPKDGDALPAEQIEIVKRWIAEGATFDSPDQNVPLASILPRLPNPDPPEAYKRPFPISAIAFHPGGTELAVGGLHEVTVWNAADGTLLRRIRNVPERVHGLAYTPDGNVLAVSGGTPAVTGEVKLFNPADGAVLKDLLTTSEVCFRVAINPAGNKLAVAGADRTVRIFDIASGNQDRSIDAHSDWVISVAWSPDGSRIATASRDRLAKVFKVDTGELLSGFAGHNEPVNAVAWLPGGNQVITGAADRRTRRWKFDDTVQTGEAGFGGNILELMTYGDKVFTVSANKEVQQHQGENYGHKRSYGGASDVIYAIAYHPPTDRLATASFNGEVRILQGEDARELLKFIAAPGYVLPTK